jgi:hypothetical protein
MVLVFGEMAESKSSVCRHSIHDEQLTHVCSLHPISQHDDPINNHILTTELVKVALQLMLEKLLVFTGMTFVVVFFLIRQKQGQAPNDY